ncbi:malate dehydrogenase (oxaloacetate-decarboxylating) [Paenibacillus phyllosphaerae]|uniref:Malate dehydrogenase (Oxaloacetate-decarboxylating) n=1 Tax=Paenibacillus phyllosphaerae TaxID=274593 RepID=A0A7W5FL08_9BACL|nr:NAD-dependent malic enzyme [Paenibacillus phyllosphaerae]MBB3108583.1 malate dehydrogenase (oxaloacetate-decarboxylating) [Paenibacillus phyllosphaerae]
MANNKALDGKTVIMRLELDTQQAQFGKAATAIEQAGGDIIAIDVIQTGKGRSTRDLTIKVSEQGTTQRISEALAELTGIRLVNISDRTFLLHLGGKITIQPKTPIQNRDDLSRVYTPEVARVCNAIHEDPSKAFNLTIKKNTVAVVSDGSAVLGLGNIGPYAAMPVMEGKAMLFKQFADVDAFPICLDTQDTEAIIAAVKALAPGFGGINLEDIAAPRCFEIEQRLQAELDIPVFHDDQHGTAVVLYAAMLNALKLTERKIEDTRFVVCGIGAAGTACTKMLLAGGAKHIIGVDREGILTRDNAYASESWQWYADHTNEERRSGGLAEALDGADVFIGVSAGGILKREYIGRMASDPIVFAMANPEPEIRPEAAEDIVAVIATGRSDYPNQINNVLCFPGIFRGALDCRASHINEAMKLAAAEAIASVITDEELSPLYIIPSVFNQRVVEEVRRRVVQAAVDSGVARRQVRD